MLILTRKVGESVVISEDVYCTVLGYWGDEVRLAFDAPKSIPVHRDEVQRQIWREQSEHQHTETHLINKENIVDRLISRFKRNTSIPAVTSSLSLNSLKTSY